MKVTVKLAHEIHNRLTIIVGHLDLALEKTKSKGEIAADIRKAKAAALELGKLVRHQTIAVVDNCEACGAAILRATLEMKREKQ